MTIGIPPLYRYAVLQARCPSCSGAEDRSRKIVARLGSLTFDETPDLSHQLEERAYIFCAGAGENYVMHDKPPLQSGLRRYRNNVRTLFVQYRVCKMMIAKGAHIFVSLKIMDGQLRNIRNLKRLAPAATEAADIGHHGEAVERPNLAHCLAGHVYVLPMLLGPGEEFIELHKRFPDLGKPIAQQQPAFERRLQWVLKAECARFRDALGGHLRRLDTC